MELEIAEKNDNPLLHRQEVQIVIRHENKGTPKRKEVIQSLSEQLKAKKDLIVIDHLKNKYGKTETQGYAKIYANIEALNRIETKPSETTDTILKISIKDEMEKSYLDYAMSVIVGRALPDARDGLKPVHRRALELSVRNHSNSPAENP